MGHITCVIHHRHQHMRSYGVAALVRLTTQALSKPPSGNEGQALSSSLKDKLRHAEEELRNTPSAQSSPARPVPRQAKDSAAAAADFQSVLLEPFLDLFQSKYVGSLLLATAQLIKSSWNPR